MHKGALTTVDQPVHCQLSGSGNVLGLQNLMDIRIAQGSPYVTQQAVLQPAVRLPILPFGFRH